MKFSEGVGGYTRNKTISFWKSSVDLTTANAQGYNNSPNNIITDQISMKSYQR